jgi:hypothetical protein
MHQQHHLSELTPPSGYHGATGRKLNFQDGTRYLREKQYITLDGICKAETSGRLVVYNAREEDVFLLNSLVYEMASMNGVKAKLFYSEASTLYLKIDDKSMFFDRHNHVIDKRTIQDVNARVCVKVTGLYTTRSDVRGILRVHQAKVDEGDEMTNEFTSDLCIFD